MTYKVSSGTLSLYSLLITSLLVLLTPFKNKLEKFWSGQDLNYNYKAELTGIGNRSF